MPFNLDLSTIQEATFHSEGTLSSTQNSPAKDQKKRSILSGLNSARRLLDDDSIVEEEAENTSAIFDEADHRHIIEQFNQVPPKMSMSESVILSEPQVTLDDMHVNGTGTYDLAKATSTSGINDVTNKSVKRPFLRRGQGKNCLNATKTAKPTNIKSTKKKSTQKQRPSSAPTPISAAAKKPTQKPRATQPIRNKENVRPMAKTVAPPPSHQQQQQLRSNMMYDQSPEDSFNISIQNEKAINKHLNQLEQLQDNEFTAIERMLADNSKLSLSQVEHAVNEHNYEQSNDVSYDDFNPDNYEDESTIMAAPPRTPSPPPPRMTRKVSSAFTTTTTTDDQQFDSMPSSINATPEKVKQVAGLLLRQFDDEQPWDEDPPSFSTPHRDGRPPPVAAAEPSKLMNSIFKAQFDAQKAKDQKAATKSTRELDAERAQLEQMRLELAKKEASMKLELARFKQQNNALEELRKQRERELEITRMERAKTERDGQKRVQELDQWERDLTQKLKEARRLEQLHRDAEKSGMVRRKELDESRLMAAQRDKELTERCDRLTAANARLKATNERLDAEVKQLKHDNKTLTERMDEVIRNSKRREGNTWREINRIVDQVTDAPPPPPSTTTSTIEPVKNIKPRKPVVKETRRNQSVGPFAPVDTSLTMTTSAMSSTSFEPGHTSMAGVIESIQGDSCITHRYVSGKVVIKYDNGTVHERAPDGKTEVIKYANGDIQQMLPDGKVIYYYGHNGTTSTKCPDGREILEFKNGQREIKQLDGSSEIIFPDGVREIMHASGKRETIFVNGSKKLVMVNGDEVILFADGQKETRTKEYRRRELPDGTTKTIFNDTKFTETRYPNGRVRIKDESGKIIVDRRKTD